MGNWRKLIRGMISNLSRVDRAYYSKIALEYKFTSELSSTTCSQERELGFQNPNSVRALIKSCPKVGLEGSDFPGTPFSLNKTIAAAFFPKKSCRYCILVGGPLSPYPEQKYIWIDHQKNTFRHI